MKTNTAELLYRLRHNDITISDIEDITELLLEYRKAINTTCEWLVTNSKQEISDEDTIEKIRQCISRAVNM